MVKSPRETPGTGPIRALNLPTPVAVEEDDGHRPASITLRGRRAKVATIEDLWEIQEEWWRARPVARTYYRVTLEDGRTLTVFRDMVDGGWYVQRG